MGVEERGGGGQPTRFQFRFLGEKNERLLNAVNDTDFSQDIEMP